MTTIYLDADGCPVKDEVYRVAERYKLSVILVANKRLNLPINPLLEMVVVTGAFDAADDWIVENSKPNDIVVTTDILLADRCLKKSVRALDPKGVEFTPDSIGSAVANRELMQELRQSGETVPRPWTRKHAHDFYPNSMRSSSLSSVEGHYRIRCQIGLLRHCGNTSTEDGNPSVMAAWRVWRLLPS